MVMNTRLRISRGGQVSVPAAIRKRWRTSTVVFEDRGDHVVLRPAPDDPIEAAMGALAPYLAVDAAGEGERDQYRREEVEAEEGKWRRYYGGEPSAERR